jgi:long-chain acyl-CoA synthetase
VEGLVATAMSADNLSDLVRRAAEQVPTQAALLYQDQSLSWAELEDQVSRAAGAFRSLGLQPGDRVAIALGNTLAFPLCYFGVLRAGLVAVPVNPASTAAELRHVLGDSGAAAVIGQRAVAGIVSDLAGDLPGIRHVVVVADASPPPAGALLLDELLENATQAGASEGSGEDLAVLIYTSGTSGRPRGAMLTHRALLANLEQFSRIEPPVTADDDVVLLVLPLFHIYGLNAALGMVALHHATGVLVERFDPVDTLTVMRTHRVSNVVGAPPMYIAWSLLPDVGDAFSHIRLTVSGAAPLPAAALARFLDATGHHVFEGYGLTETAPVLTTTLMSDVAKPASIGRAIPGVELRLLDEEGGLVHEDDPGEITVRGANLFSGYWPDGAGGPDDAGWFRTGDVAYADDDGDLYIVDRRRELILVSGFNVYPREVEDVLARHPGIEEAAVIGIPHPYTGESVKAVLVRRPGVQLTAEDVIEHCARKLAAFKCPTSVEFVAELPHSATGKTAKGLLRERTGPGQA